MVFPLFLPYPLITIFRDSAPLRRVGIVQIPDRNKLCGPEVDSLARSIAPLKLVATTVTIPTDVTKDKSTSRPPLFGSSSSSEWTVTKGFGMNDGRLCAKMIDHFTPPAFFKPFREWSNDNWLLSSCVSSS
ncbi:hypothetical protein Tco_0969804 [Tanacetum coccineum]